MGNNFSISRTLKNKPDGLFFVDSGLPFERIKDVVLGKNYELSLVFIGEKYSQTLNKKYRKKNLPAQAGKPANILSFPLSKTTGEIFIDLTTAKKEMKKFDMKEREFIGYLFIHGLLHLKGLKHGKKMEKEEGKLLSNYLRKKVSP